MSNKPEIHGIIKPGFESVRDTFANNFAEHDEIGAAFTFIQSGKVLVDIYAGIADRKTGQPWTRNTLAPVFSTGKAIVGLVMAWLVDQGRISYDTKVSEIWPEFAANGKDRLTLAQILSHQAGLSGIPYEMEASDWFNPDLMESRLAAMGPLWPLEQGGSGYHPISFGVLANAVTRRVDIKGRSIGTLLREVIAGPNDIDYHVGVSDDDQTRAAIHILPSKQTDLGTIDPVAEFAFLKPWSSPGRRGAHAWRAAELPAANGHGTALSIAQLMCVYASLGLLNGQRLISETVIRSAIEPQVCGPDRVVPFDISFACGPMINLNLGVFGPEPQTLGHYGFGGSCGFADPVRNISGAYVMNRQKSVLIGDIRAKALINTCYVCL